MRFEVLDRNISGIGVKHIDGVHAVAAVPAAVAAFQQLHMDPEVAALCARVDHAAAVGAAAADLPRHGLAQGFDHRVGEFDAWAEACDDRRRKDRIGQTALGRHDVDGPDQAAVMGNFAVHGGIQQDGPQRQPNRAIDRAFERHVDRAVGHLRRRAREIDRQLIAMHLDGHLDRQVLAGRIVVIEKTVDVLGRRIFAVRQACDGGAHAAFRGVEHLFRSSVDGVRSILLGKGHIALRADARRRHLRVHVAEHQIGQADVGAQHVPNLDVALARFVDLDGLELQAFGVTVDGVDDAAAARRMRTDVEVVRGGRGKTQQFPLMEGGDDKGDVGTVARARIGVVVHEDIAGLDGFAALFELAAHPFDVAGQGS